MLSHHIVDFLRSRWMETAPTIADMGHPPDAVSMLGQRRRRWPNFETAFRECPVFAGMAIEVLLRPTLGQSDEPSD